jgi:hypothetical protein
VTNASRKLLDLHLASWLGKWPPDGGITVTTSPGRSEPGWDGSVAPVIGIRSPEGTVISVPPNAMESSVELAATGGLEAVGRGLAEFLPFPSPRMLIGSFRWAEEPPDFPDAGEWVSPGDPEAPDWLRPYQEALIARTPSGCAGEIGVKHHTPYGHELAIRISARTAARHGLRRLGLHLGAQAVRKVLAGGAVPFGIFMFQNVASGHLWATTPSAHLNWQFITMVAGSPSQPVAMAPSSS